ncbi:glycosyltransferase family 2 protein [Providencia stuartii]|uniref:glycosyltransferase family 2 protein n=1 Tax=Providencia stuartii TaxID=588 RepID=UPI0023E32404|nr:glycosyltransferase family 2 protein [Providencia stuartii]WER22210.1 glycosyltransferase family 2 protein [Providencia stuartii]WER26331.1 glycosyltransferase family 2 protein [Providencia stuartii]WER30420.1 glycosyltransferase family 2 protein [Providencia stuartii]
MQEKTNNHKVSVIIPTYGRPDFLYDAVKSVIEQTYKNIEIIIIDDNNDSTYHNLTFNVVKKLETLSPLTCIKYFFDGINRGGSLARNKGIEISTGEFITFLDDDDIYLPDKIKNQVSHIIKNKLDVSVCDMQFKRKNKFLNISNCYARVDSFNTFIISGNAYTPMIMCSRQAIMDIEGFTDTPRYQDHILMLKFFEQRKKIGHLKEKLFIHNDHNLARITFSKKSELAHDIRVSYEKRNLFRLNEKDNKKYSFYNYLIEAKLSRAKGNYIKSIKLIFNSFYKITTPKDIYNILKVIIRIHLYPKKGI